LREAFEKTLKDPEFIKDAETQRAEIDPMTGTELAALIDKLISIPADVRAKVKAAIEPAKVHEAPRTVGKN
jgi:tripartite-type tricarboxylate transporter receptor subunit TctC